MADQLSSRRCVPCEGEVKPMQRAAIDEHLQLVAGWRLGTQSLGNSEFPVITKRLVFDNFRAAMALLRQVEEVAEGEGHHPDFCVHYNKVDFTIWTHAIGGLHENDFILAAKIDQLFNGIGAKG